MTDRLTRRWTKTAGEAFGYTGFKGRKGELLVASILDEQSIPYQDFEEEKHQQISGIDLQVGTHSIDVKSNLNRGVFFVEVNSTGWLFNPKKTSDIIIHVDVKTSECVWYTRKAAQASIRRDHALIKITTSNARPYMSRSWDDLFTLLRS
jgi:hypothetical protein